MLHRRTFTVAAGLAVLPHAGRSASSSLTASAVSGARGADTAADDVAPLRPDLPVRVRRLARLRRPWSLAFAPGGELLITEKYGGLRALRPGAAPSPPLAGGPPRVLAHEDSGLLDVALDPDDPRWVYLAFVEGDEDANRLALWKARRDGARLVDGRVIFRARPDKRGSGHPGGRLLFLPDGTLLVTVGDGYDYRDAAQDLGSHLGKTLRLTRDGAHAPDNPFATRAGALPEIYTLGHRNAQGLARDPATGDVWLHEHGPRGGDELNRLVAGANYGWPQVTHGIDYDGTLISERSAAPGLARAAFTWSPSIAPSGLAVVRGSALPPWEGRLLVGALAARCLVALVRGGDGQFVEESRSLATLGRRVRDVRVGPDGLVYLLTDADDGELLQLLPRTAP